MTDHEKLNDKDFPLEESRLGMAAQKYSEEQLQRVIGKFEQAVEKEGSEYNQFVLDVMHNERGRRLLG